MPGMPSTGTVSHTSALRRDLGSLYRSWRECWEDALEWPALRWLSPRQTVRVVPPVGKAWLQRGERRLAMEPTDDRSKFDAEAVVLPADIVLRRSLAVPRLTRADLESSVALEVTSASPFPADQHLWGWHVRPAAGNRQQIEIGIVHRAHAKAHIDSLGDRVLTAEPELWCESAPPLALAGPTTAARQQHEGRLQRLAIGFALLVPVLLIALASAPLLALESRLDASRRAVASLRSELQQTLADREALGSAHALLDKLSSLRATRVDPLPLLATLSTIIPDNAYLTRIEVQNGTVHIGGMAANATTVIELLAAEPGFVDVRAPAAIARDRRGQREQFTAEFRVVNAEARP